MNVSPRIAAAVASKKATLAELSTVLSLEDLYDVLEMAAVDAHNDRIVAAWRRRQEQR